MTSLTKMMHWAPFNQIISDWTKYSKFKPNKKKFCKCLKSGLVIFLIISFTLMLELVYDNLGIYSLRYSGKSATAMYHKPSYVADMSLNIANQSGQMSTVPMNYGRSSFNYTDFISNVKEFKKLPSFICASINRRSQSVEGFQHNIWHRL